MRNHKIWSLMLAAAMTLWLMSGCSASRNAAAEIEPTLTPAPTAPFVTPMPTGGPAPTQGQDTDNSQASAPTPMNWMLRAGEVEDRIRMFSEIETAAVVVDGAVALAGITFDGAYQGQLTERIHDMVAGEIQAADPAIQTVGVTNEAEDVAAIQTLAAQIRTGASPQDLSERVRSILTNQTTMK